MTLAGVQRLRTFLAEYGRPVGVVLLAAGALVLVSGLFLYTGAPMETVTTETDQQTIVATHDVTVTVTNSTDAYDEGTVLENQPVYLTPASDTATVQVGIDAPEQTEATVTTVVRYKATYKDKQDPFYTDERVLNQDTIENGATENVSVDSERVRQRVGALQEEFGPNVDVSAEVVTIIGYDTGTYTGTLEVSSPVSFPTEQTYRLQPADNQVVRVTQEEVTQVDQSRTIASTSIQTNLFSSIFLALVIAGFGGVAIRAHRVLSVEKERTKLEAARYSEFITEVDGPVTCPRPNERVRSIEQLVKYAKTSGRQIKHCTTTGVYVLIDGDETIVYNPSRVQEADEELAYINESEGAAGELALVDEDKSEGMEVYESGEEVEAESDDDMEDGADEDDGDGSDTSA